MTLLREVSEIEQAYIRTNMSIYMRFGIQGDFSVQDVKHAMIKLVAKHTFLRAVIEDSVFVEKEQFDLDFHLEQVSLIEENEIVFRRKLDFSEKLFHMIFHLEKGKVQFLLIVHHAIADGASAIFLADDYARFLLDVSYEEARFSVPVPIEDFLDIIPSEKEIAEYSNTFLKKLEDHRPKSVPLLHPDAPVDLLMNKNTILCIESERLMQIVDFAKERKLSVNAVLTALLILSLKVQGNICIGSSLDLRKRIKKVPQRVLFTAPVEAFLLIEVNQEDTLESIARSYQQKLVEHFSSKDLLLQHYSILLRKLNPMDFGLLFYLSNVGKANFSESVSDKILHLSFHAPAVINCPFIACVTHKEQMCLSLNYTDPWIASSLVDQMMSSLSSFSLEK